MILYERDTSQKFVRFQIAAVCDFFTYIRYVQQGIVKSGLHESYWDVITLRKNMTLTRLGLGFVPKIGGYQAGLS